jgi:hypothetical protein
MGNPPAESPSDLGRYRNSLKRMRTRPPQRERIGDALSTLRACPATRFIRSTMRVRERVFSFRVVCASRASQS